MIQVKTPSSGGYIVWTGRLLWSNKTSSVRSGNQPVYISFDLYPILPMECTGVEDGLEVEEVANQ